MVPLKITIALVDSGFRTKEVYAWVKRRQFRRIYASKGSSEAGKPIIGRPSINNVQRIKLFPIGTDTAKATLYARLKKVDVGAGYLHFPMQYDNEYFLQLTAEKKVTTFRKGFASTEWVKVRTRNEALDLTVLNMAALALLNANLDKLAQHLEEAYAQRTEPQPQEPQSDMKPYVPPPAPKVRSRRGFVKGWR